MAEKLKAIIDFDTLTVSYLRGFICLMLFLSSMFMGCLDTREVEEPLAGGSDWVSPTDYQILLNNLRTSLNQQNVQNYLRCFNRDGLSFQPAAPLQVFNESLWANWSVDDEQTYLNNLFANLAGATGGNLILNEVDLRDVSSDSLRYVGNYVYQVRHDDTTITDVFRGQLQFVMRVNTFNEWEIFRWIDLETAVDSSWSLLKLTYIQ